MINNISPQNSIKLCKTHLPSITVLDPVSLSLWSFNHPGMRRELDFLPWKSQGSIYQQRWKQRCILPSLSLAPPFSGIVNLRSLGLTDEGSKVPTLWFRVPGFPVLATAQFWEPGGHSGAGRFASRFVSLRGVLAERQKLQQGFLGGAGRELGQSLNQLVHDHAQITL